MLFYTISLDKHVHVQPTSTVLQKGRQFADAIFLTSWSPPEERFSYRMNKTIIVLKADTKKDTMAILYYVFICTCKNMK